MINECMNLKSLSQNDLFTQTQTAIREERLSTLRVLHLFREIERRRQYGRHSSLYELATKEFGYSAAAAHRRIQAMRLLKSLPDYESKLENGELSLTAAASAQSYFQRARTPNSIKFRKFTSGAGSKNASYTSYHKTDCS